MTKTYTAIVAAFVFLFLTESNAQNFKSLDKTPHDISYYRESRVTKPLVKVLYGRPSKQNQEVFGNLVPFGEVWRTGYNEGTEVKFYKKVRFGDQMVAAGTYTLLTIPGEKEWKVILSSQLDTWGAFQYNPTFNVAEVTVPVGKGEDLKTFSIAFKKQNEAINMVLGWDITRIKVPLVFKEEKSSLAYFENEQD